jgi:hypothetical protein
VFHRVLACHLALATWDRFWKQQQQEENAQPHRTFVKHIECPTGTVLFARVAKMRPCFLSFAARANNGEVALSGGQSAIAAVCFIKEKRTKKCRITDSSCSRVWAWRHRSVKHHSDLEKVPLSRPAMGSMRNVSCKCRSLRVHGQVLLACFLHYTTRLVCFVRCAN